MATKHFVIDPNGKRHTRTSQNRKYTHTILVRDGYDFAIARAKDAHHERTDRSNFAYYTSYVDGTSKYLGRTQWESEQAHAARVATDIMDAKAHLNGCTTVEAYIAQCLADRLRIVEANKAIGEYDKFGTYGWCGRRDLAEKQAAKARSIRHFDYVEIVEAEIEA